MGVCENKGAPYFGVLIIRILLFRVLKLWVPYFRKLPYSTLYPEGLVLVQKAIQALDRVDHCIPIW